MKTLVQIHEHGTTITLADGSVVEGRPHDTDAYRATARDLGYGEGPEAALAMCRDHDALHAWTAEQFGLESFALRQAAGLPVDPAIAAAEEVAVMALQKFMKTAGGRMPEV